MDINRSTSDLEAHAAEPAEMFELGISLGIDLRSLSGAGLEILCHLSRKLGEKANPMSEWLDILLLDELKRQRAEDSDNPLENPMPLFIPGMLDDLQAAQAMQLMLFASWIYTESSAVRFVRKLATILSADVVSRATWNARQSQESHSESV